MHFATHRFQIYKWGDLLSCHIISMECILAISEYLATGCSNQFRQGTLLSFAMPVIPLAFIVHTLYCYSVNIYLHIKIEYIYLHNKFPKTNYMTLCQYFQSKYTPSYLLTYLFTIRSDN